MGLMINGKRETIDLENEEPKVIVNEQGILTPIIMRTHSQNTK